MCSELQVVSVLVCSELQVVSAIVCSELQVVSAIVCSELQVVKPKMRKRTLRSGVNWQGALKQKDVNNGLKKGWVYRNKFG